MAEDLPLIVRWDSFPLDTIDPVRRFEVSRWSTFVRNPDARVIMGYWEVENGSEVVGELSGACDEAIVVLEGRLYVSTPGFPEQVAEPGDAIMATRYRRTHISARGRARAFFVIYNVDPDHYQQVHRRTGV